MSVARSISAGRQASRTGTASPAYAANHVPSQRCLDGASRRFGQWRLRKPDILVSEMAWAVEPLAGAAPHGGAATVAAPLLRRLQL
jgi:hypothetical protein